MVLHRPVELARVTGMWDFRSGPVTENPVYRAESYPPVVKTELLA